MLWLLLLMWLLDSCFDLCMYLVVVVVVVVVIVVVWRRASGCWRHLWCSCFVVVLMMGHVCYCC